MLMVQLQGARVRVLFKGTGNKEEVEELFIIRLNHLISFLLGSCKCIIN